MKVNLTMHLKDRNLAILRALREKTGKSISTIVEELAELTYGSDSTPIKSTRTKRSK